MRIPHVREKLDCLFQRDPDITTNKKLADKLSIAPNNIPVWCNGTETRRRDYVPNRHVGKICELFEISTKWLECEMVSEFKALLDGRPSIKRSPWAKLAAQAVPSDEIELVRRSPLIGDRGMIHIDDEGDTPWDAFKIDEEVYINLVLNRTQGDLFESDPCLILLVVDEKLTSCLCPSKFVPQHHVMGQRFCIPPQAPEKYFRISAPTGEQTVIALLTKEAFKVDIYNKLQHRDMLSALDEIATTLKKRDSNDWRLLKKAYWVTPG